MENFYNMINKCHLPTTILMPVNLASENSSETPPASMQRELYKENPIQIR